jgi:hypothetical protein
MKIRQLRQSADRASAEARSARRALHRHADNSSQMLSELASSPKGLLLAFGIGAATGILTADRPSSSSASSESKARDEGREWLRQLSTRVTTALVAAALMKFTGSDDALTDAEP